MRFCTFSSEEPTDCRGNDRGRKEGEAPLTLRLLGQRSKGKIGLQYAKSPAHLPQRALLRSAAHSSGMLRGEAGGRGPAEALYSCHYRGSRGGSRCCPFPCGPVGLCDSGTLGDGFHLIFRGRFAYLQLRYPRFHKVQHPGGFLSSVALRVSPSFQWVAVPPLLGASG
jgi:hypothetical protein